VKAKVKRGSGFRGLLNYLLALAKLALIIGGNMVAITTRELSTEFGYVRRLRPDVERPVLHFALRMPDGEDVSPELWNKIALRFMEKMGLSLNRPWLLVKHQDQHIHIATSRIDYDGNLWLGKWEALKAIKATHELEIEFNLTLTPTLKFLDPNDSTLIVADESKIRLTSGQIAKAKREEAEGEPVETPVKVQIAERIESALALSDGTFGDFERRLKQFGVSNRRNQAKTTDHVSGISFEFNGVAMKASKVARGFSWLKLLKLLEKRKVQYELERHKQKNEATSTRRNPEHTASPAGPAHSTGLAAGRTHAAGTQNRDVDFGLQPVPAPVPGTPAPVANANADYGRSGSSARRPAPVPSCRACLRNRRNSRKPTNCCSRT